MRRKRARAVISARSRPEGTLCFFAVVYSRLTETIFCAFLPSPYPFTAVVRFWFFATLRLSLSVSDNSVKCCKQTTYSSITTSKMQVLSCRPAAQFTLIPASFTDSLKPVTSPIPLNPCHPEPQHMKNGPHLSTKPGAQARELLRCPKGHESLFRPVGHPLPRKSYRRLSHPSNRCLSATPNLHLIHLSNCFSLVSSIP
jgi:hypothetical protein